MQLAAGLDDARGGEEALVGDDLPGVGERGEQERLAVGPAHEAQPGLERVAPVHVERAAGDRREGTRRQGAALEPELVAAREWERLAGADVGEPDDDAGHRRASAHQRAVDEPRAAGAGRRGVGHDERVGGRVADERDGADELPGVGEGADGVPAGRGAHVRQRDVARGREPAHRGRLGVAGGEAARAGVRRVAAGGGTGRGDRRGGEQGEGDGRARGRAPSGTGADVRAGSGRGRGGVRKRGASTSGARPDGRQG